MPVLRFDKVSLAYGDFPLLDGVDFQINSGERVCLVGRNGAGKSSLLKVVCGQADADGGTVWRAPGMRIGMLHQDLPMPDEKRVYDMVASGLADLGELISKYHYLSARLSSDADVEALGKIQQKLEASDGWHVQQKVEAVIQKLELPAEKTMGELSGGWRRRVELARALVQEPDLLLLDEPTNHLDVVAIDWLEKQLLDFKGALLFITHDRSFLKSLATRIVELDRGHLTSWDCNYTTFLDRKAHALEVEGQQNALFDKKLAQEEVWIRQGIQARRTRNEGRVRALKTLRKERLERREVQGKAAFSLEKGASSGKMVLEINDISKSFDGKTVIQPFSTVIHRGEKVGLIGANGAGKSTCLNLLLGRLSPDSGSVRLGSRLEIAYFDQLRNQLDLEKTVIDNVAQGREAITINGVSRHIISYLGDFLFPAHRCRVPVKALSGGERNRLLLARLFSKTANLLVMDEPTNDLDVETLELLESLLVDYKGTLLLVSHDRAFLDNVVTSTLVFTHGGHIHEFVGGFEDWLRQGGNIRQLVESTEELALGSHKKDKTETESDASSQDVTTHKQGRAPAKKKLSYKLQRELDGLPDDIEKLEKQLAELEALSSDPDFYQKPSEEVDATLKKLTDIQSLIEEKMERWEELDGMA
ncbi:ABC transporter ATP-binding protein uup [invertebrate metagenome]|uniref:ABC transporter ATP-binding protein uup n=1 Tax=invertebrate metagenome TaxID=1711999 RepID=A0A2H9TB72_9ZZZZ